MPHEAQYAPPLSSEAYARCFLTFRQNSTEWISMLRWCGERLIALLPTDSPFRALSVGAGNGDFDWHLLPILKAHLDKLKYVFVEPSQPMCDYLRQRMVDQPLPGVRFELDPETFQACSLKQAFDLVLLTHCLYYIPDRAKAIGHALRSAGGDGLVVIFHQTPLGIDQVQKKFMKRVKGSVGEMFTSQGIQEILAQKRIPYKLEQVDSHIDVSDCLVPGSARGDELLSFFLESDVRYLDLGLKNEIIAYIRELSRQEDGRWYLHHPVAIFTLGRNVAGDGASMRMRNNHSM